MEMEQNYQKSPSRTPPILTQTLNYCKSHKKLISRVATLMIVEMVLLMGQNHNRC